MKRVTFSYHYPVQLPTLGQDWRPGQTEDLEDAVAALLPDGLFDIIDAPAPSPAPQPTSTPVPATPAAPAPSTAVPSAPSAPAPLPAPTVALPGIGAQPVAAPATEGPTAAAGRALYTFDGDPATVDHAAWPQANERTVDGKLLFHYSGDTAPGDATGDGLGGVWHRYTGATTAAPSPA